MILKTLCEKEEMLVTSISSFSHIIFYPIKNNFQDLVVFNLESACSFGLKSCKWCRVESMKVLESVMKFPLIVDQDREKALIDMSSKAILYSLIILR